ncbi:Inactive tyrosine-protein kinase transmembrane receptor ror1 [Bonamia ostreae]|uniref:Inactive tyrosine-protein kinase transmembrane receptor ror1 n=1 Tax=Bonamia ostreae TaxID=126728 RepID=A0ABV2AV59_9EUKA
MDKYQTYVVLIATVATEWPIRNWIWKKDDVIINDRNWKFQENEPSIRERTLTITKLSDEDCGRYSCVAETVAGNGESEQIQLKEGMIFKMAHVLLF